MTTITPRVGFTLFVPCVRASLVGLAGLLLLGCGQRYLATSGEALLDHSAFVHNDMRLEAARRSAAHDLPCAHDSTSARLVEGEPAHILVDGCGQRIDYVEQWDLGSRTYSYVAMSRFRP